MTAQAERSVSPGRDDDLALAELLWGLRPASARGPKPSLSVQQIARVTVKLADREGLAAISMQRVASELDVTKMALYRYVRGKRELMAVMIEDAVDDPPDLSGIDGGWRPKVEAWAERLNAVWRRHPWLPGVTTGNRLMGPREVGWIESAMQALDGAGLHGSELNDTVLLLFGHIRSSQSKSITGTQPWTTDQRIGATLQARIDEYGERFPMLAAASTDGDRSPENGWRFGLSLILDGIEAQAATREPPVHR